ncbi:Hypothetical protein CAP_6712 [Chondromyces apiculatus DSM 436]|uniref:Lipoprotein n=2 Tax=Chondromyces apiculatus TaxID=51 RepID=A0A017T244_9BACT|nr:Hypothetical protein CAP_6712 [Chondromyces apiculatus DSM 436]
MRRTMMGFALLSMSIFAGLFAGGCDDVDELVNCQEICQNYADCVDSEYDVEGCRNECETKSDNDKDYASDANVCEACLDGKACAEQIECFDDCPVIL